MRVRLIWILLPLLLGGWFDDPPAWARPDGRPIDPVLFQRDRSICRGQASVYAGREDLWIVTFRVGFESHEARAIRRTSSMTDAA